MANTDLGGRPRSARAYRDDATLDLLEQAEQLDALDRGLAALERWLEPARRRLAAARALNEHATEAQRAAQEIDDARREAAVTLAVAA